MSPERYEGWDKSAFEYMQTTDSMGGIQYGHDRGELS